MGCWVCISWLCEVTLESQPCWNITKSLTFGNICSNSLSKQKYLPMDLLTCKWESFRNLALNQRRQRTRASWNLPGYQQITPIFFLADPLLLREVSSRRVLAKKNGPQSSKARDKPEVSSGARLSMSLPRHKQQRQQGRAGKSRGAKARGISGS
jgi:hypothetical protein